MVSNEIEKEMAFIFLFAKSSCEFLVKEFLPKKRFSCVHFSKETLQINANQWTATIGKWLLFQTLQTDKIITINQNSSQQDRVRRKEAQNNERFQWHGMKWKAEKCNLKKKDYQKVNTLFSQSRRLSKKMLMAVLFKTHKNLQQTWRSYRKGMNPFQLKIDATRKLNMCLSQIPSKMWTLKLTPISKQFRAYRIFVSSTSPCRRQCFSQHHYSLSLLCYVLTLLIKLRFIVFCPASAFRGSKTQQAAIITPTFVDSCD